MSKVKTNEVELAKSEEIISNKINDFVEKYNKYPKYLKLPLWVSQCMKQKNERYAMANLDYNTELLLYRDLAVCETITISDPEEIEVF